MSEEKSIYVKMSEAMLIFEKYKQNEEYPTSGSMSAEHDTIYAGPDPEVVPQRDIEALEKLGWRANLPFQCFSTYV